MDVRLQRAWDEGKPRLEELAEELEVLPNRTLDRLIRKGSGTQAGRLAVSSST
jgi:hypothetical protein